VSRGSLAGPIEVISDDEWQDCDDSSSHPSLPDGLERGRAGRKAHQMIKGRHKCRFCPYSRNCKSTIVMHERIHTGEKPFSCRFCPKSFRQKGQMVSHERTHTGEKPFQCRICHKAFAHTTSLKSHEKMHM
ncbi:unnamed protein product, partial [Ixodes hexagonus]